MSQGFRPLVSAACVAVIGVVMCFAQAEQGGISGSVVDASGASVAKARVAATNQATGAVTRVETTADGYYKIPYLPAGKYSLAVKTESGETPGVEVSGRVHTVRVSADGPVLEVEGAGSVPFYKIVEFSQGQAA